jgi:tetratricopeptide (TPR) repeat protein
VGLGHAYARSGAFPQAIAAYENAARLLPDDPEGHANLAILYLHLRRYHEAMEASRRAIARAPDHPFHHRVLGFIHDRLGQREAAVAALEREITLAPDDYEARAGLARAYRAISRESRAVEQEAAARALAADADEDGRACLESVLGNANAAVELLERALAKGQLQAGWARIDPEFAFLQDDPRYQALLQRY